MTSQWRVEAVATAQEIKMGSFNQINRNEKGHACHEDFRKQVSKDFVFSGQEKQVEQKQMKVNNN